MRVNPNSNSNYSASTSANQRSFRPKNQCTSNQCTGTHYTTSGASSKPPVNAKATMTSGQPNPDSVRFHDGKSEAWLFKPHLGSAYNALTDDDIRVNVEYGRASYKGPQQADCSSYGWDFVYPTNIAMRVNGQDITWKSGSFNGSWTEGTLMVNGHPFDGRNCKGIRKEGNAFYVTSDSGYTVKLQSGSGLEITAKNVPQTGIPVSGMFSPLFNGKRDEQQSLEDMKGQYGISSLTDFGSTPQYRTRR
jgi:hypothetical protein